MGKEELKLKHLTEGFRAFAEGRYEEVERCARRCLEIDRSCVPALKLLLHSSKKRLPAEEYFRILEEIEPTEETKPIILPEKIKVLYFLKRYDDCIKASKEFLSLNIPSIEILSLSVRAAIITGKYDEAHNLLFSFSGIFPEPERSYLLFSSAVFLIFYMKDVERAKELVGMISGWRNRELAIIGKILGFLTDDIDLLLKSTDEIINSLEDEGIRALLLFQKGCLLKPVDGEKAIQCLREATAIKRDFLPAFLLMEEIAEETGKRELLVEALEGERELLPPEEKVPVLDKLYRIYEEAGIEEKSIKVLEELFNIHPKRDVADRLIEFYTKTGAYEKAGDLLFSLSERVPDQEAVSLLLNSAIMYEKAGEYPKCKNVLKKVLEIEDNNFSALSLLPDVLSALGEWDEMIEIYRKRIEMAYDPKDIILFSMKIGEIYEMEKNDLEKASASYERVLEIAPTYLPALEAMKRVDKKRGEWKRVININNRLIEMSSEKSTIAGFHWENGMIYLNRLGDMKRARTEFENVLNLLPDYLPAIEVLKYIAWAEGKIEEAVTYLEKEVEARGMESADELFFEGAILLEKAGKQEKFLRFMKKFADKEGYGKRALKVLTDEKSIPDSERVEYLRHLSELSSDKRLSSYLLFRCGTIYKALGKEKEAERCFEESFKRDMKSSPAHLEIERELLRNFEFERLMELYPLFRELSPVLSYWLLKKTGKEEAEEILRNETKKKNEVLLYTSILGEEKPPAEIAHLLWETALSESTKAELTLEVLGELPEEEREEMLKRCIQSFTGSRVTEIGIEESLFSLGNKGLISEFFTKKLEMGGISEEEYILAGEAEKRRGNYEKALWWLDTYINGNPRTLYARYIKTEVLQKAERWGDCAEELKKIAELEEEIEAKERNLLECARIYEEKIKNPEGALDVFIHLNSLLPMRKEFVEEIKRLSLKTGKYEALEKAYRTHAESLQKKEESGRVFLELGEIYEGIGNKERAAEFYRESYNLHPDLSPLLRMERIYEEEGKIDELINTLYMETNHLEEKDKAKKLHMAGRLYRDKKGDTGKALEAFSSAFLFSPDDPWIALDLLELRLDKEDVNGIKEVLEKAMHLIPHEKRDLFFRCGKVFFDNGKWEWAREVLEKAYEFDTENLEVILLLVETYRNLSMWKEMVEKGKYLAEKLKTIQRKKSAQLLNELGEIARDHLKNEEEAISLFRSAITTDSTLFKARENLAELLITLKREKEAIEESKKVLLVTPWNTKVLHFLAYYYEKNHLPDRAFCTVEILKLLGEMDDRVEKIIWEASKEKAGKLPSFPLEEGDRERVLHHLESPDLRNFFAVAGEYFLPASGIDPLALGTSKDALVSPRSGHSFIKPLEEVAFLLGLKEVNLFISPLKGDEIISPSPASIVIGSKVARLLTPDTFRYIAAKALELSRRGYSFINILPDEKAYQIFLGFLMLVNPGFSHRDAVDPKSISKSLPLLKKGTIVKRAGEALVEMKEVPDIKRFKTHLNAVRMTAGRVALLLSGKLEVALRGEAILLREEPEKEGGWKEIVKKHESISDLLRFHSSDLNFSLREKLGTSVV